MIGKIKGASKDFLSGEYLVTFQVPELPELDNLTDKILDIDFKVHRNKRSLDANAYAWMLMSKIGDKLGLTKEVVYVHELERYGQIAFPMRVPHETKIEAAGLYAKFVEYDGGMDIYMVFRGSSTYDTAEMSSFIDGIVSDAKELGIDTVPRVELEKIKKKWRL